MGGDDHPVERLPAVGGHDRGAHTGSAGAFEPLHGRRDSDRAGEPGRDGVDVHAAAADDGAPLGAVADAEQTVVVQEREETPGGERPERVRVGRPHRGTHRDQVEFDELAPVPVPTEELVERRDVVAVVEETRRLTVEADDVAQHPPHRRTAEVAAIGEQRVGAGRAIGESVRRRVRVAVGDREAHLRVDGGYVQFPEEVEEVGVIAVVVHDEARVDRQRSGGSIVDVDGVGVATEAGRGFEQHDVVVGAELVGTRQAGDAGSDDGDPPARSGHTFSPSRARWRPSSARPPMRSNTGRSSRSRTPSGPLRRSSAS